MIHVVQAEISIISRYFPEKEQIIRAQECGVPDISYESKIRSATERALGTAESRGLRSVWLPVIHSGIEDVHPDRIAKVVVSEARRHLSWSSQLKEVTFLVEDGEGVAAFQKIIERSKIVCLGDSITYGYPDGPNFSWVTVVEETIGYTFINRGVSGETTGQMLSRFNKDVVPESPAYLLLLGGHNDAWQGVPLVTVQQNIMEIIHRALEEGICPLVGLPSPLNIEQILERYQWTRQEAEQYEDTLSKIRQWVDQYAATRDILTLDFYTPLLSPGKKEGNPDLLLDGGHPTREGYRILGEYILKQLSGKLHLNNEKY